MAEFEGRPPTDIERTWKRTRRCKTVKDAIHGSMSLPIGLFSLIDTPEFQRLRHIKQLGALYLVYDGATHTRFEHSLGTCHLAGVWMRHFIEQQATLAKRLAGLRFKVSKLEEEEDAQQEANTPPSTPTPKRSVAQRLMRARLKIASLDDRTVRITDADVFLVQVTALCHDLGHGPFSHAFEEIVNEKPRDVPWHHEDASCALVRRINERVGLLSDDEVERVEAMIRGVVLEEGRAFLYRIVHNALNSVDVDKFDYLARDCHATGVEAGCDVGRLMACSRLEGGEICFRETEYHNLLRVFHSRLYMHRQVYSHQVAKGAELMIASALRAAEPALGLFAAAETGDAAAFVASTDDVLGEIRRRAARGEEAFLAAAAILARIDTRDLYRSVAEIRMPATSETPHVRVLPSLSAVMASAGVADRARTAVIILDYAMGSTNPLKRIPFYDDEWHQARAGDGPASNAFDAAVPEFARASMVRVYAVDAESVGPVCAAVNRWGALVGLREGYRLTVSPKLCDM